MANLVLSDDLNNWSSSATVVEELRLSLSDNLNAWSDSVQKNLNQLKNLSDNLNNWLDSGGLQVGIRLTQLPVEVLSRSRSNVLATQIPVEVLTPSAGLLQLVLSDSLTLTDSVSKVIEKQLRLSDTLTMADSASAVPSAPLVLIISDSWNSWLDSVSTRLFVQLQLTVSDAWNTWLDAASVLLTIPMRRMTQEAVEVLTNTQGQDRLTQLAVEVLTPSAGLLQLVLSDNLNNWHDTVSKAIPVAVSVADSMNFWADSVTIQLRVTSQINLVLSNAWNTWLDSVQVLQTNTIELVLSDSLNSWLDSVAVQLRVVSTLSLNLSDTWNTLSDSFATSSVAAVPPLVGSMNFWKDAVVIGLDPRVAPSGDPRARVFPPGIFISS